MIKIFLTGDNHIGLKYASHPEKAAIISARMEAFRGMVKKANEDRCDLFVIAGDLFENTYSIPKKDIKKLLDMLSEFSGTVVVLPGNHDYYDKEVQVWQYFEDILKEKDNIILLNEYRTYKWSVGDDVVMFYPAHCTTLHSVSGKNNLNWIKEENIEDDNTYKVGIAHGAIEGETIDREGQYFLMTKDELENIPVDVWLIGHTHVPFPKNLSTAEYSEAGRIYNAGTHVQTDVNCNTEGCSFIIELDKTKEKTIVRAKKFISGNLNFCRRVIAVNAGTMEEDIVRALSDVQDKSVVDIELQGAVLPEEYAAKNAILDRVLSRFVEGNSNDYGISRLISKELIETEFPETSFSAGFLSALLENPKEAQLAYELLKSVKGACK